METEHDECGSSFCGRNNVTEGPPWTERWESWEGQVKASSWVWLEQVYIEWKSKVNDLRFLETVLEVPGLTEPGVQRGSET